ncbi:MAG TPA: response regulator transcription factor [Streptosporangiaceae bacterium]|jgi:DNA-binding NarL/FixJ family response regulator
MAASGEGRPVRVLVADDQRVVRDGLLLLLSLLPGIEVVGAAADGESAVSQALSLAPDVVLMDLHMPVCDGVEATRRLASARPGIPVVVLTSYDDDDSVFAALRAGARGFLTKDAGAADILRALSDVCAGAAQLDPSIQRRLVDAIARGDGLAGPTRTEGAAGHADGGTPGPAASPPPDGLTRREAEVLSEIAAGLSNAEIAAKLVVSDTTVKTHVNHLLAKTGMRDRAQLVAYAFRLGLAR